MATDRLIARREFHLREETLSRMLYETCGRAEETLRVNIEELDFAGRRCPVKAKGARPKSRWAGQRSRGLRAGDGVLGRRHRSPAASAAEGSYPPTHRRPGPGRVLSARDVCPDTGLARLSYG